MTRLRLLILFIFSTFSSFAGHELGGVILTYQSVASVNNNPLEYVLTAYMMFDRSGISLPPPSVANITQSSSCYSNTTHSLPLVSQPGGNFLPLIGADYCSTTSSIQNNFGLVVYRDTITLPGTCLNFKFTVSTLGRFNYAINLLPSFSSSYFEIKLNNTLGPNSSPTLPINEIVQAVCLSKPLNLFQFSELDGDSLHFGAGTPQVSTSSTLTYASGFSLGNQTASLTGFVVNPQTGSVQTQVHQAGSFVVTINFAEYRLDTATQQRALVGGGQFSLTLVGSSGCNSSPFDMVHLPIPSPDSLDCTDTVLELAMTRKIASTSITANGSEFTVSSKKTGSLSVVSASVKSDTIIVLSFSQTFPGNDTLTVFATNGTDGNVVLSQCGKELLANADTLTFYSPPVGSALAVFNHNSSLLSSSFSSSGSNGSTFEWDFGDGSPKSTSANPSHTYSSAGTYSVVLVAHSLCGGSDTATQVITVCDSLQSSFTSTLVSDSVYFDASNSIGVTSYYWSFGDGNSAQGSTTGHTYNQGGTYYVTLVCTNLCGDSLTISDSVLVCEDANASWTYTLIGTTSAGMTIDFDGTASTNVQSFNWDFGDGNTNNSTLTPTHLYITPSLTYMVTLTVYNECNDPNIRKFRLNQIGLQELNLDDFSLFPNPATTSLTIQLSDTDLEIETVILYNSTGKEVLQNNLFSKDEKGEQKVDLTGLSNGFYTIEIKTKQGYLRKSLIIEN